MTSLVSISIAVSQSVRCLYRFVVVAVVYLAIISWHNRLHQYHHTHSLTIHMCVSVRACVRVCVCACVRGVDELGSNPSGLDVKKCQFSHRNKVSEEFFFSSRKLNFLCLGE